MFVHLHTHSHYSFLRAVPSPQEIVAAAAEQVRDATLPESLRGGGVALTDTNGLYAAVPFYQAAREAGVKPIVGAVLDTQWRVASDEWRDKNETRNSPAANSPEEKWSKFETRANPVLLLAANLAGYSNLCALVTQRQIEEKPVSLEVLNQHREGLIALHLVKGETRNSKCETRSSLATRHSPLATLKDIFGDALYLEVQNLGPGGIRALRDALRLGRELDIPIAATNNVHFLRPEEHLHHRVLNAIRAGALLTKIAPPEITTAEAYFKSPEQMQRAFPDHPEALRATLEIAERCNLELPLGKTIFPEFPVPEGETPFSCLWKLCFEGARRRYRPVTPEVLARLTHELGVIEKLHLAPYFLLVWDIAEEARRRGIPAVARGSAASSIVTYCLGVSRVCPLRWGLYFERFLNEQRGDIPDIDLDICGARRDELLDYVYQRWGKNQRAAPEIASDRVAMIASFVTMHARLAVREVAKVFGLSPGEVNHFTRRLPHRPVREILDAIRTLPECRALPAAEEPWKTILDVALRLDDFPRHLGIHPCGTVIAAQPLTRLVPLEWATKGIVVTQYDMNAVEALGLIKMDLLGQRGLTTMSLALKNIETRNPKLETRHLPGAAPQLCHPESALPADEGSALLEGLPNPAQPSGPNFEFRVSNLAFDSIPENDPATCAMIARGRTMGIFQIESPGMRGLLRTLRAHTLDEICLALALIRPGAAEYGSKQTFLKRLRGQEPVRYPHPSLEPILHETLGICVYQEQVMQLAQAAGALSLAEADLVRRSSAKFAGQREREHLRAKFLKAAAQLGLEGDAREDTWRMVEKFAGFGFCKAHAATYADLSYRIAYLKAHYPAEFLAAMCSSGAGFYHVSAYVEEAKRWGIEVRLPSVNHSRLEYTTEENETRTSKLEIRNSIFAPPVGPGANIESRVSSCRLRFPAIRVGLMQVKGLRAETIRAIVRSREERGPYRSLEDFLARVPVERDEIESLIKCGAFDEPAATYTRPALLWKLNLFAARPAASPGAMLFPEAAAQPKPDAIPPLADYTRAQRLAYEQEILEVAVSGHPLDLIARNGETWSDEIERRRGRRVTLLGWVITFRRVGTKNYRNMMFVTLEDQRGVFEAVLFPEAYERCGGLVFETRTLRVTGRVEADGNINCEKLERAENGK
jgi:DNA-directed DNA polymerase III PolC